MPRVKVVKAAIQRRQGQAFHENLRRFLGEGRSAEGDVVDRDNVAAVAKATGIDRSVLSRIYSGQRLATPEQMRSLATLFERPDLLPSEMEEAGIPASRLAPEGLEEYLSRHTEARKITARERYYLEHSRFKAEPWVKFDDLFWDQMLAFWRTYLAQLDEKSAGKVASAQIKK